MFQPRDLKRMFSVDVVVILLFIFASALIDGSQELRLVGLCVIFTSLSLNLGKNNTQAFGQRGHPAEVILFTLWHVWALCTMFIVGEPALFKIRLQEQIQIIIMFWAIYGLYRNRVEPQFTWGALLALAVTQAYLAFSGIMEIVDVDVVGSAELTEVRATGLGRRSNSNALGLTLIWGMLGCMYFWKSPDGKAKFIRKGILFGAMLFFGYVIMISGSRKSTLYAALLIGLWMLWALPKKGKIGGLFLRGIMALMFMALLKFALPYMMENTGAGERWLELIEEGDSTLMGTLETDARFYFHMLGWEIFKQNPIAGVGIGHFRLYNPSGQVSHSDFIESLTGTGLVGFLLYQSMKVVLFIRLLRLLRYAASHYERYVVQVMILMVIYIIISGLGFHQYRDYTVLIPYALLITTSWSWSRQKRHSLRHGSQAVPGYPYPQFSGVKPKYNGIR